MLRILLFLAVLLLCSEVRWCYPKPGKGNSPSNASKKGTIRIAGPFHSESTLDRNVDPSEDSYVKKIISSNEGLNFNKDMAEAGEMFDVNGIDDLYDKNALITYEVNGHEVPVHMHPKFTPQSKSLFPEYVRDTPATMGLARQTSKLFNQRNLGAKLYNNMLSKFVSSRQSSANDDQMSSPLFSHGKAVQKFLNTQAKPSEIFHDDRLPWKTAESFGHLNKPNEFSMLKNGAAKELMTNNLLHSNHGLGDLTRSNSFRYHKGQTDNPTQEVDAPDATKYVPDAAKYASDATNDDKLGHSDSYLHKDSNKLLEEAKPQLETVHSFLHNENSKEGIDNDIDHTSLLHHALEKPTQGDDVSLFSRLSDLSQKLSLSNVTSSSSDLSTDNKVNSIEAVDPEKTKSKTKILSLLGELSAKLKGMEAVVSGHKASKNVESEKESAEYTPLHSFQAQSNIEQQSASLSSRATDQQSAGVLADAKDSNHDVLSFAQEKPGDSFQRKELEESPVHHFSVPQQADASIQEASNTDERKIHSTNAGDERMQSNKAYIQESQFVNNEKSQLRDDERKVEAELQSTEHKEVGNSLQPFQTLQQTLAAETEHEPGKIERYMEEKKPFIMDTHAIDYRPESDEESENEDRHENHHDNHLSRKTYSEQEEEENEQNGDSDSEDEAEDDHFTRDHHYHHFHEQKPKHHKKHHAKHKYQSTHEKDSHESFHEKDLHQSFHDKDSDKSFHDKDSHKVKHKENDRLKKVDDIEESLVEAEDNDSGVARERTFHSLHKASEKIKYPNYNDVKDAALFETNLLRKRYHAERLEWSDRLSDRAQQNAEKLAEKVNFDPNKIESYKDKGENIALIKLDSPNVGKDAIDYWSREATNFDFVSPFVTKKNSDFVQLMWKPAKEFGMGVAKARSGDGWIVTSYYDAPFVDSSGELRSHLQSDVPIEDPYSDIVG